MLIKHRIANIIAINIKSKKARIMEQNQCMKHNWEKKNHKVLFDHADLHLWVTWLSNMGRNHYNYFTRHCSPEKVWHLQSSQSQSKYVGQFMLWDRKSMFVFVWLLGFFLLLLFWLIWFSDSFCRLFEAADALHSKIRC